MGKYEKRRVFRSYRRAGVPFILAVHLARAKSKLSPVSQMTLPAGYTMGLVVRCDCCGPTSFTIHGPEGSRKAWTFGYWSMLPE